MTANKRKKGESKLWIAIAVFLVVAVYIALLVLVVRGIDAASRLSSVRSQPLSEGEFNARTTAYMNQVMDLIETVYTKTSDQPLSEGESLMREQLSRMRRGELTIGVGEVTIPQYQTLSQEPWEAVVLPKTRLAEEVISPPYAAQMLVEELTHAADHHRGYLSGSLGQEQAIEEEIRAGAVANEFWGRLLQSGVSVTPKKEIDYRIEKKVDEMYKLYSSDHSAWKKALTAEISKNYVNGVLKQ